MVRYDKNIFLTGVVGFTHVASVSISVKNVIGCSCLNLLSIFENFCYLHVLILCLCLFLSLIISVCLIVMQLISDDRVTIVKLLFIIRLD